MSTQTAVDLSKITSDLEKVRRYMLTVYLEVGKEIDETMSRLSKQINRLDIEINDLKLDALKSRILQSVVEEAGIAELRSQLDQPEFSKVLLLLDSKDCKDMRQYLSRIEEAVQELKSA